ncbi:MAG: hypothetical protein IJI01_11730 [Butyrivibrio sp.]|uniref:hypothetical protein n=1 Tax=Butyrivibrio sp. TaxID=28121 RepID=UPI0025C0AF9B|nr:hypothetical protein [Butyrivibrio sp.]MBQ6415714.1 hypothetical protein [Butyrivibrio sp.]MBQ6589337.1 hypothetical protein [Butyrivibrio sp.]
MKSDVVTIDNKGTGFKEAVEATKKVADFNGLDAKDSLKLQLCAEEMLSMARSITGEIKASFWVECEDARYDLKMTTQTVMDKEKRHLLLSSASSKKNEAATTFLGMLRDAFEEAMLSDSDKTYYELPDDVASDVVGRYIEDPEWDHYEQSVLRKIADDIKISIKGGVVEMTVTKNL